MKSLFAWYTDTPLIWLNIGAFVLGCAARLILDTDSDPVVKENLTRFIQVFEGFQKVVFKIIDWVLRYFPIGIFALSATCFAMYGVMLLSSYFQVAICLTPAQSSLIVAPALGINPLLDMFETACNVAGDNIGTYVIGKRLGLIDPGTDSK